MSLGSIPRILILDNDETTGSYYLLFYLYDFLAKSSLNGKLNTSKIFRVLLKEFDKLKVFRPGLRTFLKSMNTLKESRKIDKVCIYTNQLDVRGIPGYKVLTTSDGIEWSVPDMLRVLFNMLVKDSGFIDAVYTRPTTYNVQEEYPTKDFVRVFNDLYPEMDVNLTHTMFVDDRFHRKYIIDSSRSGTDENSRIPIEPYRVTLPSNSFSEVLNAILRTNKLVLHHDSKLRNTIEDGWIDMNERVSLMSKEPSNSNMESFGNLKSLGVYLTQFYLSKENTNSISQTRRNGKKRGNSNNTIKRAKNQRGKSQRRY
jgi:hypothetical protein